MERKQPSCIKCGVECYCPHCNGAETIKSGWTKADKQRYYCKQCRKRFITSYTYKAYLPGINRQIVLFTKEGLGIRSTARILKISATTLLSRIISIANAIRRPAITKGQIYEVDEMRTFIKRKSSLIWIVYALNRKTKEVISYHIGSRTNRTLEVVLKTLRLSGAKRIYTDRLKNYQYIINREIHNTYIYGTNHIERKNLTLRTHLKHLNRRTICFSRSMAILSAILKIYFWG